MKKRITTLFTGVALILSIFCSTVSFASVPPSRSEKVNVEKVTFKNRIAIDLVGDLYMPKILDKNKKYSAIVVGHPFGGVKEQTAGLYAQKLAELGYIALAFDASFYGESGGMPRGIEIPDIRTEDFSAAVDFLSNDTRVDPNKIGVLGICGAGGYVIASAKVDPRIKAIATVSMVDMGERNRRQALADVPQIDKAKRTDILNKLASERTKDFVNEKPTYTSNIPTSGPNEFYEYYRTERGQHPRADLEYVSTSNAIMMNFDSNAQIETISPRALLFIVGDKAISKHFSQTAYDKAIEPKELFIVEGATHVDMYDNPKHTKASVEKLDKFFQEYLK